ncbi:MAG: 16S rRNA (uracil(1498)-N(3))-methyltransferase [Oscillospiraceae bacterium]|jgi:16S rRNA (uracil1498-N3)-methyltransferase|nr:16S rRNA (uracil(1498)-N(3))-methyltransferase [Oscillospiraceae bacterium]
MEPRLIVPGIALTGTVRLSDQDRRHIVSVLRMREGERIILCDGNGREALCTLTAEGEASVLETFASRGEPETLVHLYPSLSKGERFEWMLQKAAELGAVSVTPVLSRRCVAGPPADSRRARFGKILKSAAEQSGRGRLPELRKTLSFQEVVSIAQGLRLFCYEEERTVSLKTALGGGAEEISVLTGPEGGYEPEEAALAVQHGWRSVSLGNTLLRCETAPLMVLSAVCYQTMR